MELNICNSNRQKRVLIVRGSMVQTNYYVARVQKSRDSLFSMRIILLPVNFFINC